MAQIVGRAKIELALTFTVSEGEARALDALAGYGDDEFIKVFYTHLGEAYMKKHEADLRTFLHSVRLFIPPYLSRIDRARRTFEGEGS